MPVQILEYTKSDGCSILKLERPFYDKQQFNNALDYNNTKTKKAMCSNPVDNFQPCQFLLKMFPIFSWLSQYNIKTDLISDMISGFTVGVMHIPQGMGYAMLGSVPPIVGIYTAFFPVLFYFIFGTSKHNSMGTFSVISILVGKTIAKYSSVPDAIQSLHANATDISDMPMSQPIYTPTHVMSSLCIVVACVHLIMYVFRFGMMSLLLSESLVSGFTTGAAIGVLTSQLKDLIGVKLTPVKGKFEIILNWYELIGKIPSSNLTVVGITAVTITILLMNNEWLKPKLSKLCIVPVPIQLIAAVGGTLASKYFDLSSNYNVTTVGHIPRGFPAFEVPDLDLSKNLIIDGIIVGVVSYTITVSIALTFAQRLNYEIDFNQELLALGVSNLCGSFFCCLPLSASLSRSTVQVLAGGRTQLTSIVSCSILALVLLWIGPFFEVLPKCVLASIIVVALKGMLWQVKDFFKFWKISRLDATVWMATFLTVVIVSIDVGLLVGIVFSLATIFIRGMKAYVCLLGHVPNTDLYLDIKRYKAAIEFNSIKIFHYCGSLNFASRASFKSDLCSLIGLDLAAELRRHNKTPQDDSNSLDLKCLIIDFSALGYIDSSGVSSLKQLIGDFNKLSISVFIAGTSCPTYEMMKKCDLNEKLDGFFNFFPTIHDAVHRAMDNLAPIRVITDLIPSTFPEDHNNVVPSSGSNGVYRSIRL